MTPWRAGCGESCTSGPEGGPGRPTGSDPGTAPRSHPYQFDQTRDGRMLKLLNLIDEHTRECLPIRVDRSIDAGDGVVTLDKIAGERGFPVYVRFDGPEFVAHAVADWCRFNGAGTLFIDPGSPPLSGAERMGRVVQWPAARRVPEQPALRYAPRGSGARWGLAHRLQRESATQRAPRAQPAAFAEAWRTTNQLQLA